MGLNSAARARGMGSTFKMMCGRTEERLQRTKPAAAGLIQVFLNVITVY